MPEACVIVANEPRAYREVLAAALRHMMPRVRILEAEPDQLMSATRDFEPGVVICSRLGAVTDNLGVAWLVLYPDGTGMAIRSVAGKRSVYPHLDFPDIVAFVDEGLRLEVGAH